MAKTLAIQMPSPRQKTFLTATTRHIGFGGARGGGKSWAVRTKAKLLALRYPGIRILIVRRTYPELINNHIRILCQELSGIGEYHDRDKLIAFPGGSIIQFSYCDRDSDLDRLQGVEYDVIFLDEATQLSEYQMKTITACLRGVNDFPKRIYYTCNPGGPGHRGNDPGQHPAHCLQCPFRPELFVLFPSAPRRSHGAEGEGQAGPAHRLQGPEALSP